MEGPSSLRRLAELDARLASVLAETGLQDDIELEGDDDQDFEPYWARGAAPPDQTDLRRPAETRSTLDNARDLSAEADVPVWVPPGYRRDGKGRWRYELTGEPVPGARDITLNRLYPYGHSDGATVLIPLAIANHRPELAWAMATSDGALNRDRQGNLCFVVPRSEWDKRAGVVMGVDAPELLPQYLRSMNDLAAIRRVSPVTVASDKQGGRLPEATYATTGRPAWSLGIILGYLAGRRGQDWRRGQRGRRSRSK